MTEQQGNAGSASGTPDGTPAGSASGSSADPSPPPQSFEQRMDAFGRRIGEAGEQLGREAEAAAERWSKDPTVAGAADSAARAWGLILLAVGAWFFADITLGLEMPAIAWRDVWPLGLILVGLVVVVRGFARRRA